MIFTRPTFAAFDSWDASAQRAERPGDLITVAVSLFNYNDVIIECLESIRQQTHQNIELVVVDDCSTQDLCVTQTVNWVTNNFNRFYRVRVISHVRNSGLAAARNTAFSLALSDYVFVIDADNTIFSSALAKMYSVLQHNRGASAVYSQLLFFEDERRLGFADIWRPERLAFGNYIDAMALIRLEAWKVVGGYDHIEGGWEDFDFWCKFHTASLYALFLPEILCCYRVHGESMLRTETKHKADSIVNFMTMKHPWLTLE